MYNKYYNVNNTKINIYNYEKERYRLFSIDSHEFSKKNFKQYIPK